MQGSRVGYGLKVLHCVPTMDNGGAERQLAYLGGELVRRGIDVHVALTRTGANFDRLARSGVTIHRIPIQGTHSPRLFFAAWNLVRRLRPDVVQTWFTQMDVVFGSTALLQRIQWILSERSCAAAYPAGLKTFIREMTGRRASAVVANSREGADYWRSRLRNGSKVYVIENALPLEEIDAEPPATDEEMALDPNSRLILSAGRFSSEKNLGTLLKACQLLPTDLCAVTVLCGAGRLEEELRRTVHQENLSGRVVLAGQIDHIWRWMKRAHVFVSVSLFEGHPNSVMEAMACGVPLVVSDIPAHRCMLDSSSAYFVDPRDAHQISDVIREALCNPGDAKSRAERAKLRSGTWSLATLGDQYVNIYARYRAKVGMTWSN